MSQRTDSPQPSAIRSQQSGPPPGLPADANRFWSPPVDLDAIQPPTEADPIPALKRLGPLPVPRGGFPLMGFLATVYDHIASHASDALATDSRHSS